MPPKQKQTKYGLRSSCCGLWSWDSKPLVNAATHEARIAAHAAFDPLWQSGRMKRREAYRWLAEAMEMSPKDCHISLMDEATARRVPEVVRALTLHLRTLPKVEGDGSVRLEDGAVFFL